MHKSLNSDEIKHPNYSHQIPADNFWLFSDHRRTLNISKMHLRLEAGIGQEFSCTRNKTCSKDFFEKRWFRKFAKIQFRLKLKSSKISTSKSAVEQTWLLERKSQHFWKYGKKTQRGSPQMKPGKLKWNVKTSDKTLRKSFRLTLSDHLHSCAQVAALKCQLILVSSSKCEQSSIQGFQSCQLNIRTLSQLTCTGAGEGKSPQSWMKANESLQKTYPNVSMLNHKDTSII